MKININILNSIKVYLSNNYGIVNFSNIYLVGGAVLEILKGNNDILSFDLDFCFQDKNIELKKLLISKKFKYLSNFGVFNKKNISFVLFRKEKKGVVSHFSNDIIIDSYRRDFSINSIYIHIEDNQIFDPFNGLNDFEKKNSLERVEQSFGILY